MLHNVADAYPAVLGRIYTNPHYQTYSRPKDAIEMPNTSFRLTDPTPRPVFRAARRSNIVFNHAEAQIVGTGAYRNGGLGLLGGDTNGLGADAGCDPEPDCSKLSPEWIPRASAEERRPGGAATRRPAPAQLMQRSGLYDVAPALRVSWQATGGHQGGRRRREDVFWTTRPQALRSHRVIDTPATRKLSDHLPIVTELDRHARDDAVNTIDTQTTGSR